jgi:hypothetical protein
MALDQFEAAVEEALASIPEDLLERLTRRRDFWHGIT